ncbi:hypothetical protein Pmani_010705 [Petrolisthes manimaculis]|uniref:Uncharacterized protein n=1 Tax=Petrolisthes manimaculis TaxID=1843537 RepID=A0AAE1Q2K0_9EUCA|nr:hypothetical protein Pmani_010705 [Petrolisthes manimaculis]
MLLWCSGDCGGVIARGVGACHVYGPGKVCTVSRSEVWSDHGAGSGNALWNIPEGIGSGHFQSPWASVEEVGREGEIVR